MPRTDDGSGADGSGRAAERTGVLTRVIRPPLQAVRRMIRAVQEWLGRHVGRLLDFWEGVFAEEPPTEQSRVSPPIKTAGLLTTAVIALFAYGSVPFKDMLPWWLFVPLVVGVGGCLVFWAIRGLSVRGTGNRFENWLRQTPRRVGLVGWERVGLFLAVVASILSLSQPILLPLSFGAVVGFGVLLGQPREERELRGVPPVPTLAPPQPDPDNAAEFIDCTFEWTVRHVFGADTHAATVAVHVPTYEQMKESNDGIVLVGEEQEKIDDYVIRGTTADVERLTMKLREISVVARYSTFEQVSSVLAMVQSIPYSYDRDSAGQEDYWRYPVETMVDKTGDCEDTTILAAALLRRLGHEVVFLLLPRHAALGVAVPHGVPGHFVEHDGQRMYFCETTGEGWRVGELPDGLSDAEVEIYGISAYRPAA